MNGRMSFEAFQNTAKRRRLLKKKMQEDLAANIRLGVRTLCIMLEEPIPDEEGRKLYDTMRQTFDAFDNDGSGQLGYSEFKEAWRFLQKPGGDEEIKKSFDNVDVDNSGQIDVDEFSFALMGGDALKYGPLADLEKFNSLLERVGGSLSGLSSNIGASEAEAEALRQKIKAQGKDYSSAMTNIMSRMLQANGQDINDFLQSKEVDKYLAKAFNQYDSNGNGELSFSEFSSAWRSMGLSGTPQEIKKAFQTVDVDNSGLVEYVEFSRAIKNSKLGELGIQAILSSIGVQIDDLLDKFSNRTERFEKLQATMKRRLKRQREMQERVATLLGELMSKVIENTEDSSFQRDPEKQKLFNELSDTFKAFDRDHNASLTFAEYAEAWRFMSLQGSDRQIKTAFDGVDIDRSGRVDFTEFVFSVMGDDAANYGYLADLEVLESLLDKLVTGQDTAAVGQLQSAQKTAEAQLRQIAQLQAEVERLRNNEGDFNDVIQRMMFKVGVSRIGPITREELEREIDTAFKGVCSPSQTIDRSTFTDLVGSNKLMELRLRKLISEIEADYWMEARVNGVDDDSDVGGRDYTTQHTAEEALHLRSFLRTSALVIQFCRRIQNKFSHGDVDGAVKASKALSHLLIRSQEELADEIERVKVQEKHRYQNSRYGRRTGSSDAYAKPY